MTPCPIWCGSDLQGEEDPDRRPAPGGVGLSILDPGKGAGGLVLVTGVRGITESADRKVFLV